MIFCFRLDNDSHIGDGHLFRCKAIAQHLATIGHKNIYFVVRSHNSLNSSKLSPFKLITISVPEFTELGDAKECLDLKLSSSPMTWIVDHYGLGSIWEKEIRQAGHFVMSIDDLGRRHESQVILDQNISSSENDYIESIEGKPGALALVGPEYSLLQESVRNLEIIKRENHSGLKNILVFLGSARLDQFEKILTVTKKLSHLGNFRFLNPPLKLNLKPDQIVPFQKDVTKAYQNIDLVIGACGVSQMERYFLGIPTICMQIVDNQKANGDYIEKENLSPYLGNLDEMNIDQIEERLKNFISLDANSWNHFLRKTEFLINKDGVKKVGLILSFLNGTSLFDLNNVNLTPGIKKDVKYFYDLRRSLLSQKWSENKFNTSYNQHIDWFYKKLESPDYIFATINYNDIRIGYIRLDEENNISIAIETPFIGKGAATKGLIIFSKFLLDNKLKKDGDIITAHVLKDNIASSKIFMKAGYTQTSKDSEKFILNQKLE